MKRSPFRIACLAGGLVLPLAFSNPLRADINDDLAGAARQFDEAMKSGKYEAAERAALEQRENLVERQLQGKREFMVVAAGMQAAALEAKGAYLQAEPLRRWLLDAQNAIHGPEHKETAASLIDLANLYDEQGRYAEAEPLCRRAVTILEKAQGPEHPDLAVPLNNLANLYRDQGRYADAEPLYKRALAIKQKALGPEHLRVATTLNNLANLYNSQARYAEAEPLYQRALGIEEKLLGPDHPQVAATLSNLAVLDKAQGRNAQAEPLYQRALAIREKVLGAAHPDVAESLNNLANLYDDQGRRAEAEALYRRALAILEKALGPSHPEVAATLNNLAVLEKAQGQYAAAEPLVDRAIAIEERSGAEPDLHFYSRRLRADLHWHEGRRQKAVADLDRAMDLAEQIRGKGSGGDIEHATLFAKYAGAFVTMVAWQTELGDVAKAFQAAERARARSLMDQLQLQGTSLLSGVPQTVARELRRRDAQAKGHLAELQKQGLLLENRKGLSPEDRAGRRSELERQLAKAQEDVVESYRQIRNASPACRLMVGSDFKPVALEQLRPWVAGQQALLLEYVLGTDGGYLLVIAPTGKPELLKLEVSAEQAKAMDADAGPLTCQRLRAVMSVGGRPLESLLARPDLPPAAIARLAQLWRLLVPTAQREALTGGKYKRLIVIPDGLLALLPFETLVAEPGAEPKYLLDAGPPIIYGPSATVLYKLSEQPRRSGATTPREPVLSVANPDYGRWSEGRQEPPSIATQLTAKQRYAGVRGSLTPLPNTATESAWIAENFRQSGQEVLRLVEGQATKAKVRDNLARRKVVHLACHGVADQTYGNFFGALALTPGPRGAEDPSDDGFLTLAEIYELDLAGCELAILSACETNYGPQQRGEGVWALSRGFLVAGSRRVVASNWVVDDEAAASLVSYFCGGVALAEKAGGGAGYAQALQRAKRWVRQQEAWSSPFYWAPFVLIGPD